MMLRRRGAFVSKSGNAPTQNPPQEPTPQGQLLFSDNLEGSTALSGWNIQNGGTAYALQHQAAPGGGKALRFELRAGDPPNNSGTRTEVYYPQRLQEAWYSFKCYFPSAEYADETGNSRESICQFHQGGGSGSPYNMLLVEKGQFRLFLDNDMGRNLRLDIGPQTKDTWHEFVFYTKFSQYEEGHIKLWKDGSLVADEPGANLAAGFSLPELKLGLYKWDWNNGGVTTTDKRVLWLDDVKVGNKDATYAQMSANT